MLLRNGPRPTGILGPGSRSDPVVEWHAGQELAKSPDLENVLQLIQKNRVEQGTGGVPLPSLLAPGLRLRKLLRWNCRGV